MIGSFFFFFFLSIVISFILFYVFLFSQANIWKKIVSLLLSLTQVNFNQRPPSNPVDRNLRLLLPSLHRRPVQQVRVCFLIRPSLLLIQKCCQKNQWRSMRIWTSSSKKALQMTTTNKSHPLGSVLFLDKLILAALQKNFVCPKTILSSCEIETSKEKSMSASHLK